jgi:ferredoxin
MLRDVIIIDEARCDGCGQCVTACAEGALAIIDGKARLVSEVYCDGLGACLGHCPQGAITVVKKDVAPFDQRAVDIHLQHLGRAPAAHAAPAQPAIGIHAGRHHAGGGCPGAAMRALTPSVPAERRTPDAGRRTSLLGHWPIQLALLNPAAPYLQGCDLVLTAHCAPPAIPDYHERWLQGRCVALACPKLDDLTRHTQKLTMILQQANPASLTVLKMEVPCCGGLAFAAKQAIEASGWQGRFEVVTAAISG